MNDAKPSIGRAIRLCPPYTQHINNCRKLKEPLLKLKLFYHENVVIFYFLNDIKNFLIFKTEC